MIYNRYAQLNLDAVKDPTLMGILAIMEHVRTCPYYDMDGALADTLHDMLRDSGVDDDYCIPNPKSPNNPHYEGTLVVKPMSIDAGLWLYQIWGYQIRFFVSITNTHLYIYDNEGQFLLSVDMVFASRLYRRTKLLAETNLEQMEWLYAERHFNKHRDVVYSAKVRKGYKEYAETHRSSFVVIGDTLIMPKSGVYFFVADGEIKRAQIPTGI